MKTLILLRHAKAEAAAGNFDDFERALTARGRTAAAQVGEWLAASGTQPDLAFVSTAQRAQQTWDLAVAKLFAAPAERRTRALYLASPGDILAQLAEADAASAGCVIVVGHNPGLEILARLLAADGSEPAALDDLARGMPTAGLAVLALDVERWADAANGPARLVAFVRPRDLAAAD